MLCTGKAFHKHYMNSDLYYSHVYHWRDLSWYLSCWMCCYKCHIYTPEYWCCRISFKLSCVWWKKLYMHIHCCTSYKQIAWICVAHLRALCSEPFPQRFSDKCGIPISFCPVGSYCDTWNYWSWGELSNKLNTKMTSLMYLAFRETTPHW